MARQLLILEVSKKQDYIFSSKKLRDNVAKSKEIAEITGVDFFKKNAPDLFNEKENMVYSGGGHTVLQFETKEQAVKFADVITKAVIMELPEIEVFVKCKEYDQEKTPGENLKKLAKELEDKKSLRKSSFRYMSAGIEKMSEETLKLEECNTTITNDNKAEEKEEIFDGLKKYNFPNDIKNLAVKKDNFIAVVHIDGNAMGTRVNEIYEKYKDWEQCCNKLQEFSNGIQEDFEAAFEEMVKEMRRKKITVDGELKPIISDRGYDPVKLVILAGDDVCFITSGNIGIECARVFLEKLSKKTNKVGGTNYSACAGVAIVHSKYPFHKAYQLSEELCSNAKKLGVMYDKDSPLSLIDWHIEFGQMKDGLGRLREDYITEDGNQLELRPYIVSGELKSWKEGKDKDYKFRSYEFFRRMAEEFKKGGNIARGKIKELRIPMKQGVVETNFYIKKMQINGILDNYSIKAEFDDNFVKEMFGGNVDKEKLVFKEVAVVNSDYKEVEKVTRNLMFDAIEVIDHYYMFEEGKNEQ